MDALARCFTPPYLADMGNSSTIPWNVFDGPQNNVYHNFCDRWAAGTELTMTVDASGNRRDADRHPVQQFPIADLDAYLHYNIGLGFTPSNGDEKCARGCVDAFSQLSISCRQSGDQDQFMQGSGSLDVGCGVFDYTITPTTPLEMQERHCYGTDDFGAHDDIHLHDTKFVAGFTCAGTGIKPIKRGDPSTHVVLHAYDKLQPVQTHIYWKEGCVLDYPGADEIYPANPLALDNPGSRVCQNLIVDNWRKCNNKGAGGSIQVGCLVYDFKPKHD